MKKTTIVALLLLGASGCATPWTSWLDTRSVPTPNERPAPPPPLPPGPITADIVEPANAHRVAEAIWDEMDRDQQRDMLPASQQDAKNR